MDSTQGLMGARPSLRDSSPQLPASPEESSLITMTLDSAVLENFGASVARASGQATLPTYWARHPSGKDHTLACPSSSQAA